MESHRCSGLHPVAEIITLDSLWFRVRVTGVAIRSRGLVSGPPPVFSPQRRCAVKSKYRLSGLVTFAAFLCVLPSAFGQRPLNNKATSATNRVLNYQPPSFLAFALTSGNDLYNNNGRGNQGNNNGNNGNNGNGGYGNGGYGNGGYGGGGCGYGKICSPPVPPPSPNARVPEGGTPLMYLLLAGLSCVGAMVLRSRRQASMPETN
jgi:hypothetical protein